MVLCWILKGYVGKMENKYGVAEQTKKNLMQAFWRCYEKKPFTEVTVKSVTQIAGYNRSTFYQYFDNMNDLMEQAEDELLKHLKQIADETIATELSENSLEKGLRRWADECGNEFRAVLGPYGDMRFLTRFKDLIFKCLLRILPEQDDGNVQSMNKAALISGFTSAVMVSAGAYLSIHPDTDQSQFIHILHSYIYGGVTSLLSGARQNDGYS